MKICFLIHHKTPLRVAENAVYLVNAANQMGHDVALAQVDSIQSHGGAVGAKVADVRMKLTADTKLEVLAFEYHELARFDVVWVLSLGTRTTFLDKMQLLRTLPVYFVNTPQALVFLHSKLSQHGVAPYPETHSSSDQETLWEIYRKGGAWVVKPAAESFGRNVFLLNEGDSNARAIFETMTQGGNYCLLQRYVQEVKQGEKRVLLAGGEIIGQYRKRAARDHRGNLHQGGVAELCELEAHERVTCEAVAAWLLKQGVRFAGLDMAGETLLEWNIISPGGIGTLERLGGGNIAKNAVFRCLAPFQT